MIRMKKIFAPLLLGACAIAAALPVAAQDKHEFAVVGTWGQLDHWKRESAFWKEALPKASGGRLTANARPLTELGMDGHRVMRDLRSGAFDFAHGVFLYVAADSAVIEGGDLAGVVPDLDQFRKVMDAYKDTLNKEFETRFGSKILMLYAWDQSNMFCRLPASTPDEVDLSVFKGLKIRSYGSSTADFISRALDATPVPVPFGEVLQSIEKGVIDCGVSGVLSAYDAKWWQVATHNVRIPLGYTASFLAVNKKTWDKLSTEDQNLIQQELAKLEEDMWIATAANEKRGLDCNTDGPCEEKVGGMKAVTLTPEAMARMKELVGTEVVQAWADRCDKRSPGCGKAWSDSIGKVVGYELD
jgi:TRAP-type C4-dicarboxylate transport system substrate-binding protein